MRHHTCPRRQHCCNRSSPQECRCSRIKDGTGRCARRSVVFTHTVVHVVTDAVAVFVGRASATTYPKDVFHVACTIAGAFRNVRTATTVDRAWTVARRIRQRRPHKRRHRHKCRRHIITAAGSPHAPRRPPRFRRSRNRPQEFQHIRSRKWHQDRHTRRIRLEECVFEEHVGR